MGRIPESQNEVGQGVAPGPNILRPSLTPHPLRLQVRHQMEGKGTPGGASKATSSHNARGKAKSHEVDSDNSGKYENNGEEIKASMEESPLQAPRTSATSNRYQMIASIRRGFSISRGPSRAAPPPPRSTTNLIAESQRSIPESPLRQSKFPTTSPSLVPQRRGAIRRPGFSRGRTGLMRGVGPADDGPMGKARAPWADDSAFIPRKREPRRAINDLKLLIPGRQNTQPGSQTSQGHYDRAATGSSSNRPVSKFAVLRRHQTAHAQTFPEKAGSGGHGGPSTTFDDILEKVSEGIPDSATSSFPISPAPGTTPSMMNSLKFKSLTASTRRGFASALKKGQEVMTPKSPNFLVGTTKLLPKLKSPARANTTALDAEIMRNPSPTGPAILPSETKRLLQLRSRGQWTRDLPSPEIPTGLQEIEEVERILKVEPGLHKQSPEWNLARHSWRSMELRTRWEHKFPQKTEDGEKDNEAQRVRWNRLEARRRVRLMSRVQDDFIARWETWVAEQSAEVQAEACRVDDNERVSQDGRKYIVPRDPTNPTLKHYFDDCLIEVDEAFERQKQLAERLVARNARRFVGMK
ncbi:hypothetical protein F4775DRAFT_83322 [Biscogniauxia sp. FL1348]|nr:hypothetical protein F4775DRAFT_83322 [Biscogniauxia sp. FL1348]